MGSLVVVTVLFLGFGLSLPWVIGHKEKVEVTEKLTEKTAAEKKLKTDLEKALADLEKARTDLENRSSLLKEIEEELAVEVSERNKAEEARLLTEKRLQLTEEEKKKIEEECGAR